MLHIYNKLLFFLGINIFLLLVILLFIPYKLTAQKKDEIHNIEQKLFQGDKLNESLHDSSKVRMLTNLCWLYRNNKPEKSLEYGKKAIEIAEKLPNLDISPTYSYMGVIYRNIGNLPKSVEYFLKAHKEAKNKNNQRQLAFVYQSLADIENKQAYTKKAEENIRKALDIFEKLKDNEGLGYTYHTWGQIAENKKDYGQALSYHYKALQYRYEENNERSIASSKAKIALIYYYLKKNERALEYANQAYSLFEKQNDMKGTISTLNILSDIYYKNKDFDKSLELVEKALRIRIKSFTLIALS
jgi:tetratricopeptide (TPR) repeat protein